VRDSRAELALRRQLPADGQLVGEGAGLQQVTPGEDLLRAKHTRPVSSFSSSSPCAAV